MATGDPRDIEAGVEKTREKDREFFDRLIHHSMKMHAETGDRVVEAMVGRPDLDRILRELHDRAVLESLRDMPNPLGWNDIVIDGMHISLDAGSRPGCFILKTETHTRMVSADETVATFRRVTVNCPRCGGPIETLHPEVRHEPVFIPMPPETEESKLRERLRLKVKASYATHAQVIKEFCDGLRREGINLIETELIDAAIQKFLERIERGHG